MSTTTRLLARGAAATLLVAPALAVSAAPGQAAACQGTSGVTVVVQYSGGVDVRCAPGDPTSGADALKRAGFTITDVQTQPGFVCRISGQPSSDPCVRTPPGSASWSFWRAEAGGSWAYSSYGAYSPQSDPAPGSYQGWRFGAGSAPAWSVPAAASAPTPSAAPSSSGGVSGGSSGSGSGGSGSGGSGSGGSGSGSSTQGSGGSGSGSGDEGSGGSGGATGSSAPAPGSTPSAPAPGATTDGSGAAPGATSTPSASSSGRASATAGSTRSGSTRARTPSASRTSSSGSAGATAGAPQDVLPTSTPVREEDGSSALPALAGLGLVALLGAGAVIAARRRRA
ncbi:hypothetical protein GCM10009633_30770 [Janibacter melonis]|uniref:hypothetical protein n=1 Tax=Janibacter melonis TaxID=262209 RepID=UPI001E45C33C|nr:hypothetical protein [Janibacter melonis]MCB5992966.1 hypothetical protein [Janibacter melonis]